jgi:predicted histone-like DNA-binding protein
MALKVKAVERLLKFDKNDPGSYRYVLKPELYTSLDQKKVIREAALRSGVSQGVMKACWDAAGEVIKAWATEGHAVALPGLGSMRFGLRSKSVEKVEDVKTGLITSRRIIFTPSVDLKDELANTAIQISCIDRNGKEVKRVTSTSGEVEDEETSDQTTSPQPSPSGEGADQTGNENQGGGGTTNPPSGGGNEND